MRKVLFLIVVLCISICSNAQIELLTNGSFSQANSGWTAGTHFVYNSTYTNCQVCPGYAHADNGSGQPATNLYDYLTQPVSIPSSATSATLSFYTGATLSGTSVGTERLFVYIYDYTLSQTNVITSVYFTSSVGYSRYSFPVPSSCIGHSLQLGFRAESTTNATTIRVDEVSMTYTQSNNFTLTVHNVGGAVKSNAKVILYNSNWVSLQTLYTDASGQVIFPSLANGTYYYEVYYTPSGNNPPITSNTEFWGSSSFSIAGSSVSQSFTRVQPYISANTSFSPTSINIGQSSSGSFTVTNALGYSENSYVSIWVDRDEASSWDYINSASAQSINSNSTYNFPFTVSPANSGTYNCYAFVYSYVNNNYIITDQYAWTTAFTATTATGCTPVSVSSNPANQSVTSPNQTSFSVGVSGTSPFSYTWQQYNGSTWTNLSNTGNTTWTTGTSSSTLTISNSSGLNGYQYRCNATNCNGVNSATSSAATLTTTSSCSAVSVLSNPSGQSVTSPSSGAFSVNVSGSAPFSYQWQQKSPITTTWTNLTNSGNTTWTTGTNSSTLTIANSNGMNGYQYRCNVTNCGGANSVISNAAVLTVSTICTPVTISSNPTNQNVTSPNQATFSVGVSGTSPFSYKWQQYNGSAWSTLNNSGNTTWTTGSNSSVLTIGNTNGLNGYQYRCNVTNCSGASSVTTTSATLTLGSSNTSVKGIDVSHWQGSIAVSDWQSFYAAGKLFAYAKATEGVLLRNDDTCFVRNMRNGCAAGLIMGAYDLANLSNTGASEANHFLSVASPYIGAGFLPPALDLEYDRIVSLPASTLTPWVQDWVNTIYNQTGITPAIYINGGLANASHVDASLNSNYLWVIQQSSNASPPTLTGVWNGNWTFNQYVGDPHPGLIAGFSLDFDQFNGSTTALYNLTHPSSWARDLTITSGTQHISSSTTTPGTILTAYASEDNTGNRYAGANFITLWLSRSSTLNTSTDIYLGKISVPSVSANSNSLVYNTNIQIPSTIAAGNYTLFFWADGAISNVSPNCNCGGGLISETDECNNFASVPLTVNSCALPSAVSVNGGGTYCASTPPTLVANGTGGTIYWQGARSGGTSTSAPSTSHLVTSSGTYYFRANNTCGWGPEGSATVTITSGCKTDAIEASIENVADLQNEIKIYPNPSNSQFTIEFESKTNGEQLDLVIYDMTGRLVKTYTKSSSLGNNKLGIDLNREAPGIYTLAINGLNGKNGIFKILKN
ncbi:MAG: T9SS type A sorting domain-containing protein [Bacteroidetes bacterium]|nr:T9SS type A sorting domain-containing protein [Bacteroidota bacterium]